jgi:phthiodiolone/phenolphthiodiolone dimycocerosates ketoreductase
VKTERITLGAAVTDTQRSHPSRTAHQVASLDQISRGRAILGIGAGEEFNVVPYGLPWGTAKERVKRMVEAITIIRLLWKTSRESRVNFDGATFKLVDAFLSQRPYQSSPAIYVGAFSSRRSLRVVGALADGWFAWLHTPDTFANLWSIVKDAAEAAGRSPHRIERCIHFLTAFPTKPSERKTAELVAKTALLMEKSVLTSLGYNVETAQYQHLKVGKDDVANILNAAQDVPDDFAYKVAAIGGEREVEEKIEQLSKAGVNHFAMQDLLAPKGVKKTLRRFGKIVRRFR